MIIRMIHMLGDRQRAVQPHPCRPCPKELFGCFFEWIQPRGGPSADNPLHSPTNSFACCLHRVLSLFRMNQSLEQCCRICTMAEGYYELGLYEEAFRLVESLPSCLKTSAQSTLLRLKSALAAPTPTMAAV